ncbi:MAG TPA: glycosyltransferase [Chitinophagaceae bacterium]
MDQTKTGKTKGKPRILLAPLDWGLGHATRCIPVIRELLGQDCEVWLAAEGPQEKLLKEEFPLLPVLPLPGYRIKYARSAMGLLWQMLVQYPKFLQIIRKENVWLKQVVKEYAFDAVISDNRFGLYHEKTPSIFITHQLNIKSPFGKWSESILQKMNYRYINRYTTCWVPDEEGTTNLAGELSHPGKLPAIPVNYIGCLSRFSHLAIEEKKDHLLFLLSGPEPQRTIFENKIIAEVAHYNGTATIVRGLPGTPSLIPSTNMIRFYNHLSAEELNKEMLKAAFIISRSGYSTVMDIATLQKKSVLIPTPGQTEQEYLSKYLSEKKLAFAVAQHRFFLAPVLQGVKQFSFQSFPSLQSNSLKEIIAAFIRSLRVQ